MVTWRGDPRCEQPPLVGNHNIAEILERNSAEARRSLQIVTPQLAPQSRSGRSAELEQPLVAPA